MNEKEFAYRLRLALDEGAEQIDAEVGRRLERARQVALARQGQTATARLPYRAKHGLPLDIGPPLGAWMRLGLAAPLLALVVGIVGIQQWQLDRMATELADLDLAVLLDDTPIDIYAHQGFGVYLREENDDNNM